MATQPPTKPEGITFIVPGQRPASRGGADLRSAASELPGRVKDAVKVAAQRSADGSTRVTAVPGQDLVLLRIEGGPALVLHPETARDLMLSQSTSRRGAVPAGSDVQVPAQLRWQGLEQATPTRSRGFLGDVLLSGFEVITDLFKDKALDFAVDKIVEKLDGQVDAGVYALSRKSLGTLKGSGQKLMRVQAPATPERQPLLVLIHGTFVDTASTFKKLWELHPQSVAELFDRYDNRVYALDHPTVSASPIANALTLVQALPSGARLHLVTHSRGGLVAEVLARVAGQGAVGVDDLAWFPDTEAYKLQRAELQQLGRLVGEKNIQVDRVLRVACPAHGTLLASKRLDAYLSVLKWTIELAGIPVVPALVDFLTQVAQRRTRPDELPGLASMMPDAPLLSWLNGGTEGIPGDLRVVAGDLQGDSVVSWLKTLLADAYYWTDNDIVVQTRSMYGGSPRSGGASFLLDQGGKTTHFNYFANERTVKAVVNGLTQASPEGFSTIGPLSWSGQDASGLRSARRSAADGKAAADKPAVLVLPGILGSNLKAGDKRIWLSLRLVGGLDKLKYDKANPNHVQPDGPIGMVYDDLLDHLAQTHDVKVFAFDWRLPIEDEAERLADAVEAALDERKASKQPVRILAHSMGGVVTRTMLLRRPQTFKRMMDHKGARFVMLGTPNGGSWAPMQVLSGDDTFGNALASFGSPLRDQRARQLMAEMPGFIQLQAQLLDPQLGLDREATWADLARRDLQAVQQANWWHRTAGETDGHTAEPAYAWGVPPQQVLDQARQLRVALDAQLLAPAGTTPAPGSLHHYADQMALVVGSAKLTPVGFEWTDKGLVYLNVTGSAGDGRVPLDSAQLPGVRTWTLDCEHGSLPDARQAFNAYVELLEKGETSLLQRLPAAEPRSRGGMAPAAELVRSRPARAQPQPRPAAGERAVFDTAFATQAAVPADVQSAALKVTVLNGNLAFSPYALMVGHSRSHTLTGTEAVLDTLLGGGMKASLDAGLYPDAPGSQQLFVNTHRDPTNPWRRPQPAMAIVIGLGGEGQLTERQLTYSVRQGVLAWSQRLSTASDDELAALSDHTGLSLAATLMGSGGIGMQCSNAARAIAQGVHEANEALKGAGWPLVKHLCLMELYLERASDAWNGLQVLAASAPDRFAVESTIKSGVGPLRRQVDNGYRGTDFDLISVSSPSADSISFTLDTKRARSEVRAQSTQGRLVRSLVKRASTESNHDPQLGHTLFQLLVPVEVEPFLAASSRMLLELDERTAAIPWELLDTRGGDPARHAEEPWAIRTRVLRRLRQDNYRQQVQDAQSDDAVLVIGEPMVDNKAYPALPGARAEAEAVRDALLESSGLSSSRVVALIDDNDASSIINGLFQRRYRIVHVAGHGEPVLRGASGEIISMGGVVLSEGAFLGPSEINAMRVVPELVFVNCCHLAARDTEQVLRGSTEAASGTTRPEFAMGVADALISIGVRCVIAAGWAVDDEPAKVFAQTFYRAVLNRRPFIDAVASARQAAWNADRSSNTWAAYQAYGDPNWVFRRGPEDAPTKALVASNAFENIASPLALTLALEEVAVQSKWMHAQPAAQLERLQQLEHRFAHTWGGMGAVAEAFAVAYQDSGDKAAAMRWYERALGCADSSASLKVHEQLANMRVRVALSQAQALHAQAGHGPARGAAQATKTALAVQAVQEGRAKIHEALDELNALSRLYPTVERLSLLGSAWKRLALLDAMGPNKTAERESLKNALTAYRSAETLAAQQTDPDYFYPALNRMALEIRQSAEQAQPIPWDGEAADRARANIQNRLATSPDFWSHVGLIELQVLEAAAAQRLAPELPAVLKAYRDVAQRVSSSWLWASVADQALFVLMPYGLCMTGTERGAARDVLELLIRLAHPGEAEGERELLQLAALQPAASGDRSRASTKAMRPSETRLGPAPPEALEAVVWHAHTEAPLARALDAALRKQGYTQLWHWSERTDTSDAPHELRDALARAPVAFVVLGSQSATDSTLREWTQLQEAAWRTRQPTTLVTISSGSSPMPGFLRKAAQIGAPLLQPKQARALAERLRELKLAKATKP